MGKKKGPKIPAGQLRKSKALSDSDLKELRAPDGSLNAGMPIPAIRVSSKTEIIIVGGGGGPNVGLRNGLIFARLSTNTKKPSINPIAELETNPFICQSVAVHPTYSLQMVLALDTHLSFCEFETFEPDPKAPLPKCEELYRVKVDTLPENGGLNCVTFNKSGTLLLCAGLDQHIRVYNYDFMDPPSRAMPLKPVMDLNAGSDEVESISVSQSDTFIAACCDKKYVLVWNRKTSDSKPRQIAHEGLTCRSCEFHGEDLIVLACDRKNHRSYLIKFDVAKNKVLRIRNVGKYWGKALSISPCGKYFAASFRITPTSAFVSINRTSDLCPIDYQYGKEMVFSLGWMDDSKTIVYTMPSQEQRVEAYQISFPRTWSQLFLDFLLFVFVILLLIALFPETFLSFIQYMERMSASPFAKEEL